MGEVTRPTKKPAQSVLDHYREQMERFAMTRMEVAAALKCGVKTTIVWIPIKRGVGWPKGRARPPRSAVVAKPAVAMSERRRVEVEKRARLVAELESFSR